MISYTGWRLNTAQQSDQHIYSSVKNQWGGIQESKNFTILKFKFKVFQKRFFISQIVTFNLA